MKKLTLICSAFFALAPIVASAQFNQTVKDGDGRNLTQRKEQSQPATGSMFINERYMPARLSNNETTTMLRYNAYSDHFEMNNPQADETKMLPKTPGVIITFVSNNESYTLVDYKTEEGNIMNGYLNIISDSPKVKFYKRELIKLQPEVFPTNSYQSYKAANYKRANDEYYVQINGGEAMYFKNKKDLAKLLPEKSKDILNYIKKNDIDVDEEEGLMKLGTYMESIL